MSFQCFRFHHHAGTEQIHVFGRNVNQVDAHRDALLYLDEVAYATSAGMAVAYPLIPKVRPVVTTKTILLIDLLLQVILSFICAQVNQMGLR